MTKGICAEDMPNEVRGELKESELQTLLGRLRKAWRERLWRTTSTECFPSRTQDDQKHWVTPETMAEAYLEKYWYRTYGYEGFTQEEDRKNFIRFASENKWPIDYETIGEVFSIVSDQRQVDRFLRRPRRA